MIKKELEPTLFLKSSSELANIFRAIPDNNGYRIVVGQESGTSHRVLFEFICKDAIVPVRKFAATAVIDGRVTASPEDISKDVRGRISEEIAREKRSVIRRAEAESCKRRGHTSSSLTEKLRSLRSNKDYTVLIGWDSPDHL